MLRLRGGEDAPTAEEVAAAEQLKQEEGAKALKVEQDKAAVLQAEFDKLKGSNRELEDLLLDPAYAEFLEAKKAGDTQAANAEVADMNNAELMQHMTDKFSGMLDGAVSKISGASAEQQALADIEKLRGANTDFDLYQDEMIAVAKQHPSLNAGQVYKLAKAEAGPKVAPALKGGEVPNSNSPGGTPAPKGMEKQLDAAWKTSGIGKILESL